MFQCRVTLVGDGSSDRRLLRPLEWVLDQHCPENVVFQTNWADLRGLREAPTGLEDRVRCAIELYPCEVIAVHRDAERDSPTKRYAEIADALDACSEKELRLMVVPVRMQEAWFVFCEAAIRAAAGNPNGKVPLKLPRLKDIEGIADPKELLFELLKQATELSGRRIRRFNVSRAANRVADLIDDFAPLRTLSAFEQLEDDVVALSSQIESFQQ